MAATAMDPVDIANILAQELLYQQVTFHIADSVLSIFFFLFMSFYFPCCMALFKLLFSSLFFLFILLSKNKDDNNNFTTWENYSDYCHSNYNLLRIYTCNLSITLKCILFFCLQLN